MFSKFSIRNKTALKHSHVVFFSNNYHFNSSQLLKRPKMGKKQLDPNATDNRRLHFILVFLLFISCFLAYKTFTIFNQNPYERESGVDSVQIRRLEHSNSEECCRGIENMELWGSAVKWGTDHKFNNSKDCCNACKKMCSGEDGPCLCDSWVFCGDRERCGEKFGECWLKKQNNVLFPALQQRGERVIWTSGLIFGKGEGIISLETEHGNIHIKLMPDCAPHSVSYIVELLGSRHCAGCQFYRAEGRGDFWDTEGNHIIDAPMGPPYALIQGKLEAEGIEFEKIATEACPRIRRGSVAWVGSGPEFFISLANHDEWRNAYTVFAHVLTEDLHLVEKIASLPTKPDAWNNVNVSVLEKPVPLRLRSGGESP